MIGHLFSSVWAKVTMSNTRGSRWGSINRLSEEPGAALPLIPCTQTHTPLLYPLPPQPDWDNLWPFGTGPLTTYCTLTVKGMYTHMHTHMYTHGIPLSILHCRILLIPSYRLGGMLPNNAAFYIGHSAGYHRVMYSHSSSSPTKALSTHKQIFSKKDILSKKLCLHSYHFQNISVHTTVQAVSSSWS